MLWRMLAGIIKITGRLVAVILGFALLAAGIALCFTIIGMIVGIPLLLCGALLMVRGMF